MTEGMQTGPAGGPNRPKSALWIGISAALAAAVVAGLLLSNVASGQTADPGAPAQRLPQGPLQRPLGAFGVKRWQGAGGGHLGMGGPIHGEFVAPRREGGFATYAMQTGQATAVGDSSITVKSDDGYEKTYAVTPDTRVNRDGKISDIKNGVRVGLIAIVENANARALRIVDEAFKQRMIDEARQRWGSLRPGGFSGAPEDHPALSGQPPLSG